MNYHAVTHTFSHSEGSCMNFPPTHKWNYSIPNVIDENHPTIFVDQCIPMGMQYPKKYKFGWLCESSEIIFEVNNWIKENTHLLEQCYEKIFVNDESFLSLSGLYEYVPPASNMPWINKRKIFEKTKLVSIIASNKNYATGHKLRHKIINKYKHDIEVYGSSYKKIETKDEGIVPFMFSICIENSKYDTYYTEKVTDAIACGTVPIYWGTDKINTIFNPKGFIFLDDNFDITNLSKDLYESKLDYIKENLEILKQIKCADDVVQTKMKDYIL